MKKRNLKPWLIPLTIMAGLYVYGMIHSYRWHSKEDFHRCEVNPLWAMWRGIESGLVEHPYKEKDKSEIESEHTFNHQKLLYYEVISSKFLNDYYDITCNIDDNSFNRTKEFNTRIKYFDSVLTQTPQEYVDSLKSFSRLLILRTIRSHKDFVDYWSKVQKNNGYPLPFLVSDSTNQLTKLLMIDYHFSEAICLDSLTQLINKNNVHLHFADTTGLMLTNMTKEIYEQSPKVKSPDSIVNKCLESERVVMYGYSKILPEAYSKMFP